MKVNELVTFRPLSREREHLPCFPCSIVGRQIECRDQSGVVRLLNHDRVLIEELRGEHALVSHKSCKGGVLLVAVNQLEPIPAAPTKEDDHL